MFPWEDSVTIKIRTLGAAAIAVAFSAGIGFAQSAPQAPTGGSQTPTQAGDGRGIPGSGDTQGTTDRAGQTNQPAGTTGEQQQQPPTGSVGDSKPTPQASPTAGD